MLGLKRPRTRIVAIYSSKLKYMQAWIGDDFTQNNALRLFFILFSDYRSVMFYVMFRCIKYVMRFFVVNNTTKVPKIWIINGRKKSYCCKKYNKMNNIFVQIAHR